jgi:hypothetical protein
MTVLTAFNPREVTIMFSILKTRHGLRVVPSIVLAVALAAPVAVLADASRPQRIIDSVRQSDPALADELAIIYEATRRFEDVEVALAEGFVPDPMNMCERASHMGLPAFLGAMGIHYFRPDLLEITDTEPRVNGTGTYTNFRAPGVLIYEPQADGTLQLVALENLVFAEAWSAAGHSAPPDFMGRTYFHMINNPLTATDEAHNFEPHYDLHLWLYRENPHGLFSPFNPAVSCEHHSEHEH